jgi:hypothetical protein
MLKNQNQFLKYFFYFIAACTLIPLGFYCYVVLKYSTNAPYYDDFYWGISFLDNYISANTFVEKLKLIFQQHAQHRIAYFRLFMVGYYHLFGTINFKHLTIIGNIGNLVIFFLLASQLIKRVDFKYFILPIALIFFQFQFYQNIICTYAFPNNAVYLWVILAFYAMTIDSKKAFISTLIFAVLSVFSNGNGIISFPIILFFLFMQSRFSYLKIASIFFGIFIIIYFSTFDKAASEIQLTMHTVSYFFQFLNAAFNTGHRKIELVGVVLIVGLFSIKFLIDCYNSYFKKQEVADFKLWVFVSATILWIIATALSVGIYRGIHNASIPNWYLNYSVLLIIFFTIFLLINLKNSYLKALLFVLLTGYGISNYLKSINNNLPTVSVFQSNLRADVMNFQMHKNWSFLLTQIGYPLFKEFEETSYSFYEKGLYVPPTINKVLLKNPSINDLKKGVFEHELSTTGESIINFRMLKNDPNKNQIKDRFGFIKSAENIYYFGIVNPINTNLKDMIFNRQLFGEEPFYIIPPKFFDIAIKQDSYQFGVVFIDEKNVPTWYVSDKIIKIEN